jgi:hypothetical protein
MKKKLQKDLRWLKNKWIRFVLSIGISLAFTGIINPYDPTVLFCILSFVLIITLYFFIAWLYGDE